MELLAVRAVAFVRYRPEPLARRHPEDLTGRARRVRQVAPDRTLSLTWQGARQLRARLRGRAPGRASRRAWRSVQATAVPTGQGRTNSTGATASRRELADVLRPRRAWRPRRGRQRAMRPAPSAFPTAREQTNAARWRYELLESDREVRRRAGPNDLRGTCCSTEKPWSGANCYSCSPAGIFGNSCP